MAFGCFKPTVVLEGIHARFLERKGVPVLIECAHRMLDADDDVRVNTEKTSLRGD